MNKSFAYLSLAALLLPGCGQAKPQVSFQEEKLDVYSFLDIMSMAHRSRYADPVRVKNECFKGSITLKVHPNYKNLYYADFPTYCRLLQFNIPEGYSSNVAGNEFTVSNAQGKRIFVLGVDTAKQELYYGGTLALGMIGEDESSFVGALTQDMEMGSVTLIEAKDPLTRFSYADYAKELPVFAEEGSFLAPLSLYDAAFGGPVSASHIFDGEELVQYNSYFGLAITMGEDKNAASAKLIAKYKGDYPQDLRIADKASLYFIMDNLYGLRDHRGIKKMSNYFDSIGMEKALLDGGAKDVFNAYVDLFATLDDDHTGLNYMADWVGDDKDLVYRSSRSADRKSLKNSLTEQRTREIGSEKTTYGFGQNIQYSTSGKTAYFYFDSFTFDMNPYDESNRENLWQTDTYFYVLHQFEEIVKHGGVERVVIDDSCNSGGTLGICIKLLALISKDNYAEVNTLHLNNGSVTQMSARLDSNQDGKYDNDDVFGDDFEISILTSPGSFSCGNLFPWSAKANGNAKIIGQRSGGGECTVASAFLPSGRGIQYSSNDVLCDYKDGKIIRGIELGATPDITIPYCDFYNIDALEAALTK